jgi:hypothetical protein
MRSVSGESSKESYNIPFMFNNVFSENRTVYEVMWKNILEPAGPQMT